MMVHIEPTDVRIFKTGFAKVIILEPGKPQLDYYAQKYEVIIGRRNKKDVLDIALDESNAQVSRQHARIFYDFDVKVWKIEALGKNGLTVDGQLVTPPSRAEPDAENVSVSVVTLQSQARIYMGDAVMWFMLPERAKLKFLERDFSKPRDIAGGAGEGPSGTRGGDAEPAAGQRMKQEEGTSGDLRPIDSLGAKSTGGEDPDLDQDAEENERAAEGDGEGAEGEDRGDEEDQIEVDED